MLAAPSSGWTKNQFEICCRTTEPLNGHVKKNEMGGRILFQCFSVRSQKYCVPSEEFCVPSHISSITNILTFFILYCSLIFLVLLSLIKNPAERADLKQLMVGTILFCQSSYTDIIFYCKNAPNTSNINIFSGPSLHKELGGRGGWLCWMAMQHHWAKPASNSNSQCGNVRAAIFF